MTIIQLHDMTEEFNIKGRPGDRMKKQQRVVKLVNFERFEIDGRGTVFHIDTDDYVEPNFYKGSRVEAEDKIWRVANVEMFRTGSGWTSKVGLVVTEIKDRI